VTYSNLSLAAAITSPDHPVWQWLEKRRTHIAGLSLELRVDVDDDPAPQSLPDWMQPLHTLSSIPDVQLKVEWVGVIADLDHPYIDQWLRQHGKLISKLTVEIDVSDDRLKLRDFSEAAASCRSIDLTMVHIGQGIDFTDLAPVAGSLLYLYCEPDGGYGSLRDLSAFRNMTQLRGLQLDRELFPGGEAWGLLAKLTGLQMLSLEVIASGDPSLLSALTGLSALSLYSRRELEPDDPALFSFSSLQPLSTLQQLQVLHLGTNACAATSLEGLVGLSKLESLEIRFNRSRGRLRSLEGISPGVIELCIFMAPDLVSLVGLEGSTRMEKLSLQCCGVSSLEALSGLSSLKEVMVSQCSLTSVEGLNSSSLQTLTLAYCSPLPQLGGFEHLSTLQDLAIVHCDDLTSLQPLSQLGKSLQKLTVEGCLKVQEEVLELPYVQPTADVVVTCSNVKEVVLAGG
jgi:hypothetical protein